MQFSKSLRERVKAKTGGRCWYCGCTFGTELHTKMCVDHVIPKTAGGANEIDNLVPSCRSCNGKKRDLTLERFRRVIAMADVGIWFSEEQVAWLTEHGFDLDALLPRVRFYYEEARPEDGKTTNDPR
jgi:5-methylcytosine-specific restriction endonuclease McrA